MKLDDLKNERAIEALADMFDPIIEIASDDAIKSAARSDDRILMVKLMLKNHSRAIFELMAASESVPVEEYECNVLTLPMKLMELFNRPEFSFLFPLQSQKAEKTSFGSAMESIEGEDHQDHSSDT